MCAWRRATGCIWSDLLTRSWVGSYFLRTEAELQAVFRADGVIDRAACQRVLAAAEAAGGWELADHTP